MQPLLLFGGTFDPVHRGHVAAALDVAEAFAAPVHLMPAALPPHREAPGADAPSRLRMLELAIAAHPQLQVDGRELERNTPSWTIDTLRQVRAEIGVQRPLVILVGADAFSRFDSWREWQEIFALAHVLVLTRPGVGDVWSDALQMAVDERCAASMDALRTLPCGKVLRLEVMPVPVSSSDVRARLGRGESCRDLLSPAVADYIEEHELYR